MTKKILLIDNFDSFTFNLVDYFKQLDCEVEVYRNNINPEEIEKINPDLIVISPGPSVPRKAGNLMKIIDIACGKYPIFGVCLGHEALIEHFGGSLKFIKPVHGKSSKIKHDEKGIFKKLDQNFEGGRYHSLVGDKIPKCFEVTAKSEGLVMAIRHKTLPIRSVQFHPESVLTMKGDNGFKLIKNLIS
jgi:anthranilate synthase/aminodeoxychorismate synthase-like glutamine amidotransferase